MPNLCVVYGCSNKADPQKGIGLHKIPFLGDDRPECVRRRKKWVDFVLRRRAHWKPTKNSVICSLHFRREDFSRMFTTLPGQEKPTSPRLLVDELGPCVFPTIQANDPGFGEIDRTPPMSERSRRIARKVRKFPIFNFGCYRQNLTFLWIVKNTQFSYTFCFSVGHQRGYA